MYNYGKMVTILKEKLYRVPDSKARQVMGELDKAMPMLNALGFADPVIGALCRAYTATTEQHQHPQERLRSIGERVLDSMPADKIPETIDRICALPLIRPKVKSQLLEIKNRVDECKLASFVPERLDVVNPIEQEAIRKELVSKFTALPEGLDKEVMKELMSILGLTPYAEPLVYIRELERKPLTDNQLSKINELIPDLRGCEAPQEDKSRQDPELEHALQESLKLVQEQTGPGNEASVVPYSEDPELEHALQESLKLVQEQTGSGNEAPPQYSEAELDDPEFALAMALSLSQTPTLGDQPDLA